MWEKSPTWETYRENVLFIKKMLSSRFKLSVSLECVTWHTHTLDHVASIRASECELEPERGALRRASATGQDEAGYGCGQ